MKIIAMTNDLVGDESKIPQDEDIRKANELFKDMFDYDIATGTFKDVMSPLDLLKEYKAMNRNVLEHRLGDELMGPIERRFKGPMFDWGSIDVGVSKILEEKQRKKVFGEVATVEAEETKVQLGDIPEREPYEAPYEGLDPEDPEDKAKIEYRAQVEQLINMLKEGTADLITDPAQQYAKERYGRYYQGPPIPKDLPMRSKSLQEWMFSK